MKWFKSLSATLLLLGISIPLIAQELPQDFSTDILLMRSPALTKLDQMGEHSADLPISPAHWRQIVFELQQASNVQLAWPDLKSLRQRKATKKSVSLALVHAAYERYQNENEMVSGKVFAFAPLRPDTYYGEDLNFIIKTEDMLHHANDRIIELFIDADDGLGLRPIYPGVPLQSSYSDTGVKSLRLQALLSDGRTLQATSQLNVIRGTTPDPTATWELTASESWDGIAATGKAYLYLAEGHSSVTNPVVVVEGFDIDNTIDWPVLYDLLNRENLLEDLRSAGFDAVVLDFDEAVDPIQRNALLLVELLNMVNAETTSDQSSALIGASMGGLVSRYALLWMEQQNISHRVRNFIAFDSPIHGANIPLGVQEWVSFFASESAEAEYLLGRLDAPASRQMLLYHLNGTAGVTAGPDPALALLQDEFSILGAWPQSARLVSIINGSGAMLNQGFAAADQVIFYEYRNFLVDIDGDVWSVPDGGSQLVFDGRIDPLFGGSSSKQVTIAGSLPWDNSPGGQRNTFQQLADVTAPFGDIVALHDNHNFIPTISALALDSMDPFYDIADDLSILDQTPFTQVYFPEANQQHIAISTENKTWFLAEIQAGITVSPISGVTTENGGTASFTITANSPPISEVSISLSSSDPNEGSVSGSVVLPNASTTPQLVTVTGVDDMDLDGNVTFSIITGTANSDDKAYAGIDPVDVVVTNVDNDVDGMFSDGFEVADF